EALQEELAYLEKENQEIEQHFYKASQAYNGKQEKYREAKMLNDKFIELDTYEKDYTEVMLQTDFYKRYEKELQAADQANQIRTYEEQVHIRQKEQATNAEKLTHQEQVLQSAKQSFERAKAHYEALKAKESKRAEEKLKMKQYEEFLPIVQEMDEMNKAMNKEKAVLQNTSQQIRKLEEDIKVAQQTLKRKKSSIKEQEVMIEELPAKQQEIVQLQNQYKIMKSVLDIKQ